MKTTFEPGELNTLLETYLCPNCNSHIYNFDINEFYCNDSCTYLRTVVDGNLIKLLSAHYNFDSFTFSFLNYFNKLILVISDTGRIQLPIYDLWIFSNNDFYSLYERAKKNSNIKMKDEK